MASVIIELAVKHRIASVDCILTHTFFRAGYAGGGDLDAILADWQGDPQTAFLATQFAEATLTELSAGVPNVQGAGSFSDSPVTDAPHVVNISEPGTRSSTHGTLLPPYVCQTHTIRTATGGRRYRGRNFWSGAGEGDVDTNGFLGGAGDFGPTVQNYYEALDSVFGIGGTSDFRWVIASRRAFQVAGFSGSSAEVTSFAGRRLVHTLRSRRT